MTASSPISLCQGRALSVGLALPAKEISVVVAVWTTMEKGAFQIVGSVATLRVVTWTCHKLVTAIEVTITKLLELVISTKAEEISSKAIAIEFRFR